MAITATDRGTPATVTALSLNTDYWLVLKIVGSVVTAYLYAADGTSTAASPWCCSRARSRARRSGTGEVGAGVVVMVAWSGRVQVEGVAGWPSSRWRTSVMWLRSEYSSSA